MKGATEMAFYLSRLYFCLAFFLCCKTALYQWILWQMVQAALRMAQAVQMSSQEVL